MVCCTPKSMQDVRMACKVKVQIEDGVFECTKYGMMMKVTKCSKFLTARMSVGGQDGKVHTLTCNVR